jgi:signal peptide peptidase SppA
MNEFAMEGDLLIAPEAHAWVENLLTKLGSPEFVQEFTQKVKAMEDADGEDDFWEPGFSLRPYNVKNGVLTIPVKGMLMAGLTYALGNFATGYTYIARAVLRGVDDSAVKEIVLEVNSPGGTVPGLFDAVDTIYAARGKKPIRAVANEAAYSAAYAIASAADDITVARTGGVGSIGVMTRHVDMSKALEQRGVKVTAIFAGARKNDGAPDAPLSDAAKARMQSRVDALHGIFVATVARNRDLDEQAVRDTEAATFMAQEAVENGLADAVGPLDSLSANADPSDENEDEEMSNKNDNPAVDQAAHDAAVAKAKTEGEKAGASAERERVKAIMDSEEAKARPAAARHIAMNSDMSVEDATAFLKGLPEEAKAPEADEEANGGDGGKQFENAMNDTQNPELGAGNGGGNDQDDDDAFMASYRSMRGLG